jgi:hypothetical protein
MHALKTGKDYEILASFFLIAITEKVTIKNKGKMSHDGNSGIAAYSLRLTVCVLLQSLVSDLLKVVTQYPSVSRGAPGI